MLNVIFAAAAMVGILLGGPAFDKATIGNSPEPSITAETVCPKLYGPVICDDGKIYINMCWAEKHHATGCVPYGEL